MERTPISRRNLIQVGTAFGAATIVGLRPAQANVAFLGDVATAALSAAEIAAIDTALGKKGAYNESQATHVVPFPRNDLKVTVKGEPVPIPLGFGGWAAFKKTLDGSSGVFMSDNVLLEEEVNPLIDALHQNGLEIGALHNHFFFEQPRIFFMHAHGMGPVEDLAARYAKAISQTKLAPANQPKPNPPTQTAKDIFDIAALDAIIGKTGVVNGPAYKYTVGRADLKVSEMKADMTAAIGLNTWCTFVGTPDSATVAGDVAMLAPEVNPVIKTLRGHGLEICAVHSHMLSEKPRILFLHYLGRGKAIDMAKAFRAVLDELGKHGGMDMEMGF